MRLLVGLVRLCLEVDESWLVGLMTVFGCW